MLNEKKTAGKTNLLAKSPNNAPAKKGGLASALGTGKKTAAAGGAFAAQSRIRTVNEETLKTLRNNKKAVRKDKGYLGYIIDATASRSNTWNLAKKIQGEMFEGISKVGNLSARVVAFRGGNSRDAEIIDHGWHTESKPIIDEMERVECRAGYTQIFNAIQKIIEDDKDHLPTNIVMIGDMCEEVEEIITHAIRNLQAHDIKVFAFHEGDDRNGENVYRNFAKHTGGAFAKFGPQMPLEDLCEAVGVYTVGDTNDFEQLMSKSKAAALIGKQVLRIEHKKGNGPKGPTPKK